jgi:starch synthase
VGTIRLEVEVRERPREVSTMRVLYVAAECKPFSKVGGVGDVAGELPPALREEGIEIEIATPLYRDKIGSFASSLSSSGISSTVSDAEADRSVEWLSTQLKGVPVFLLDSPDHFRGPVYISSPSDRPYWDDAVRFSHFSAACLDLIERRQPDIVHVNDWVLGYLMGLMDLRGMPQARVLTVHNVQYQGNFWSGLLRPNTTMEKLALACGDSFRDPHAGWDCVNALRLGLEKAHMANTVSPNYAWEMTGEPADDRFFVGGCGLEEIVRGLYPQRFLGILNGFEYNPGPRDEPAFRAALQSKAQARALVASEFTHPGDFLLGFVGRAVEQKIRLLSEHLRGRPVLEHLLEIPGVNLALVASGEAAYESFLRGVPEGRGGVRNFSAVIRFDPQKADLISRGCDVFLMPSLFEPCGITQLESMARGTPPLVRRTGGLADTVIPHTEPGGTGFVFDGASREGVLDALVEAVKNAADIAKGQPARFLQLQENAFRQRFSWRSASIRYIDEVYKPALSSARATLS